MHTIMVITIGLLLLGACALVGRLAGGHAGMLRAFLAFLPLWLIGAALNMYIGVRRAGYGVAEEAPIFLVVFAVPAALALGLWWKLK